MVDNLFVVAALVIILWIIILGIFLVVSRRQPDIAGEIEAVEKTLLEETPEGSEI
ncbi:MAG: hypothetical protein R6X18_06805 [Chloroflexota bacterium]|jgi:hypothetical protein